MFHQRNERAHSRDSHNKHHKKMAMQEEHIMYIALNGENYCSAIHRRQRSLVC